MIFLSKGGFRGGQTSRILSPDSHWLTIDIWRPIGEMKIVFW